MKTSCLTLLAVGSFAMAAEPPPALTFKSTTISPTDLKLSRPIPSATSTALAGRSAYFPATSTTLIAPSSTRQITIHDSGSDERDPTITDAGAHIRRRSTADLIGPSKERDELIEGFKARAEK